MYIIFYLSVHVKTVPKLSIIIINAFYNTYRCYTYTYSLLLKININYNTIKIGHQTLTVIVSVF